MENEKRYKKLLEVRNKSILAHGNTPILDENYLKFEELVLKIAKVLRPNIEDIIKETEFPKF